MAHPCIQGWTRDLPSMAAARRCDLRQDTKESIQLRSQALEESSVTEEGLPASPQMGLASDKMPIDRRQRCCTPRTQGHGFRGIKSPGAGRHTLPRLGRYCSSNCSAPVTCTAKGTSLKAVPRDAFPNPPPRVHHLLSCSLERAVLQLQKSLNCSSSLKLCAGTSGSMRALQEDAANPKPKNLCETRTQGAVVTGQDGAGGVGHRVQQQAMMWGRTQ